MVVKHLLVFEFQTAGCLQRNETTEKSIPHGVWAPATLQSKVACTCKKSEISGCAAEQPGRVKDAIRTFRE